MEKWSLPRAQLTSTCVYHDLPGPQSVPELNRKGSAQSVILFSLVAQRYRTTVSLHEGVTGVTSHDHAKAGSKPRGTLDILRALLEDSLTSA